MRAARMKKGKAIKKNILIACPFLVSGVHWVQPAYRPKENGSVPVAVPAGRNE